MNMDKKTFYHLRVHNLRMAISVNSNKFIQSVFIPKFNQCNAEFVCRIMYLLNLGFIFWSLLECILYAFNVVLFPNRFL